MSVRAIDRVWRSQIKEEGELLVALALADWADDNGVCYPNQKQIAKKARQSKRNVQYVIAKLGEKKLLEWIPGKGRGNTNVYRLMFENMHSDDEVMGETTAHNKAKKRADISSFEDIKGEEAAPINTEEKVQSETEKAQPATIKGAKAPHARGKPSLTVNSLSNKRRKHSRTQNAGAREDVPELEYLKDIKIPLSEKERQRFGDDIEKLWSAIPRGDLERLYRATFGKKMNGSRPPSGFEVTFLHRLSETYPWEWLVPTLIVASGGAGNIDSAHRYAETWTARLSPDGEPGGESPITGGGARASPLPDPPLDSFSMEFMEQEMETFSLEESHFIKHETNRGDRWTLSKAGKKVKRKNQSEMIPGQ